MNTTWPVDVLEAAQEKRLVPFVGAGVSRACLPNDDGKRPASWQELLESIAESLELSPAQQRIIAALIEQKQLLQAAEACAFYADQQSRTIQMGKVIVERTSGRPGQKFSAFGNPWIDAVMGLEPKIILTTNYDTLLDDGFNVHSYDSRDLGDQIRQGYDVLIKLHGTCARPNEVILTQSSYSQVRRRGSHVYEVVQSLLMTRPCLFVGYSLADPDIHVLLENVVGAGTGLTGHYILLEDGYEDFEVRRLKEAFGLAPIFYPVGDHEEGARILGQLAVNGGDA